MRKIISLICLLLPILAHADQLEIRENAPDRHVVVKGDTLWGISATFFKDPWKWQQIWGLNKDTIKDPHWIYPGDVVFLDRATGTLRVGEAPQQAVAPDSLPAATPDNNIVKLSPRIREIASDRDAIPVIPLNAIGPFLAKPLIIEDAELAGTPTLVGTFEHRELLGTDDIAYVKNLPANKGADWQIYRLGKTFIDPETKEILGHEARYLGDAVAEKFADISEVRITKAVSEIGKGDYLSQFSEPFPSSYEPRAPNTRIVAKVISIFGGVAQASQNAIITLNKGKRDGLENGHVLAVYQKGEVLKGGHIFKRDDIALPDVRYGLVFVFRTFQKVSYALVLQTRLPVQLQDTAQTP
ncbi:MAG: LysM peptidoglycan-binding domain-containing protein [Gallionellaceae bacterium]|nr:MAG: LysM peptidoglycan-binding domain-containing protein [Gallionellaceae bacterium]